MLHTIQTKTQPDNYTAMKLAADAGEIEALLTDDEREDLRSYFEAKECEAEACAERQNEYTLMGTDDIPMHEPVRMSPWMRPYFAELERTYSYFLPEYGEGEDEDCPF
jgi:hypothetical protein